MSLSDELVLQRGVKTVFFLVDASERMAGIKIAVVNDVIKNLIPKIRKIGENDDFIIKIAVMEFSSSARWLTKNGPEEAEKFVWQNISASGMCDMGEACRQLAKKLSTREGGFMRETAGFYTPAIFMFSNGWPTDDFDSGLAALKENSWFRVAVKTAIAIGEDANTDVLARFAGHKEAVVKTHDPVVLAQLIKFVNIDFRCLKNNPRSYNVDNSKQEELNKAIAAQVAAEELW